MTLRKGERMTLVTLLTKGWRDTKVFSVNLAGSDASFTWFIAVFGQGTESFPFDVTIRHTASRTTSRVYARGVLEDRSRIHCSGCSTVTPRAHGADTYVSFHTLLLSPDAHARTIPSLEIHTPDVKAGHAASVDRLVPPDLFYLQSRGLDERTAQILLIQSFLIADLQHLGDDAARVRATEQITACVTHAI